MSGWVQEEMLLCTSPESNFEMVVVLELVFRLFVFELEFGHGVGEELIALTSILQLVKLSVFQSHFVNEYGLSLVRQPWLLFINVMELSVTHDLAITQPHLSSI